MGDGGEGGNKKETRTRKKWSGNAIKFGRTVVSGPSGHQVRHKRGKTRLSAAATVRTAQELNLNRKPQLSELFSSETENTLSFLSLNFGGRAPRYRTKGRTIGPQKAAGRHA